MIKYLRQNTNWSAENNPNWRGGLKECVCAYCHSTFKDQWRDSRYDRKFCSFSCYTASRAQKKQPRHKLPKSEVHGENHFRWSGKKFCKTCNAELLDRNLRRVGYCSSECKTKARSKRLSGSGNPRWKGGHVYCKQCGIEILKNSRLRNTFCSRKCLARWQSENMSGINSPIYNGGTKPYPPEWNTKLREKIRHRDGYVCQTCGKPDKSGMLGARLSVHHIDFNKQNCAESNLISLCNSCHQRLHKTTGNRKDD